MTASIVHRRPDEHFFESSRWTSFKGHRALFAAWAICLPVSLGVWFLCGGSEAESGIFRQQYIPMAEWLRGGLPHGLCTAGNHAHFRLASDPGGVCLFRCRRGVGGASSSCCVVNPAPRPTCGAGPLVRIVRRAVTGRSRSGLWNPICNTSKSSAGTKFSDHCSRQRCGSGPWRQPAIRSAADRDCDGCASCLLAKTNPI